MRTECFNVFWACLIQLELNAIFFLKFVSSPLKFPGIMFNDEEPIKSWFGVSGSRSVMSLDMAVRRFPFNMDSTSHKKV